MLNPKNTIIDVLEIISYQHDKEKFSDDFIELCMKQSFLELIGEIPKEKVEMLKIQMKSINDLDQYITLLKKYINPPLLKRKIEYTSAKLFQEYIDEIFPTLDENTKEKLMVYLGKVGNSQ